jgi:hypothetical protein
MEKRGSRKEIVHYSKMGDGGRKEEEGDSSLK